VLWRAIFAFLALPGIVAFAVPLVLARSQLNPAQVWPIGLIPLIFGIILLLYCVREFYVAGRGTLAPWSPPRHLVTTGPYRYSRNPMYIGAGLSLAGAALFYESVPLLVYGVIFLLASHLFVLSYEEPTLRRIFGSEYEAYCHRVRRWWPRV